ncbi:VIT1/CCC1 transporter family protein [Bradyrhizobium sp.]|uniref:VIT1/CCC1 transporter family protein n=1 Tax=Bradyrhizobium sp. TaxID=376 RepID=UPI003C39419C
MKIGSALQRLRDSFINSAGTVVFGMEDGTVSIFGLIFGVAATTTSAKTVLIAGASGAAAAAVSMMAGVYLDAETTQDKSDATVLAKGNSDISLSSRLIDAGLTPQQSNALAAAVQGDRNAADGLLLALKGASNERLNPFEQALWMLFADFLAAAVPILPFVFLPIDQARIVSGTVTVALLLGLGIGRAQLGRRNVVRTVVETVSMGIGAALAGVAIGVLINHSLV